MEHFLTIDDFDPGLLRQMLEQSHALQESPEPVLKSKNVLFVFEKPSLRTRTGTEVAINHLGGNVLHVEPGIMLGTKIHLGFGLRETLGDTMQNVSQWCDAVFARVFRHDTLLRMGEYSDIPIVNALCDQHHPMQAMADIYTIREEFGPDRPVTVTFVGDANNVARSLIEIGLKFGYEMRFSGPEAFSWGEERTNRFHELATLHGGSFFQTHQPEEAVKGADVVYTDTFISMGEEEEMDEKMRHFEIYRVDKELFSHAGESAIFMHCLPAHRGVEVTDEVIDHPRSRVYRQAKNRMIVSKGIFATLLCGT
ncbi:MAG: ornithine carbamoyltransferase [Balneolaceae bacterium]